jgi:2-keto-3-deoxy-6-phosphogluconate aldolase
MSDVKSVSLRTSDVKLDRKTPPSSRSCSQRGRVAVYGITTANAAQYLALPNVGCVGGSWITPSDVVASRDWARITELAAAAATL